MHDDNIRRAFLNLKTILVFKFNDKQKITLRKIELKGENYAYI